MKSLFAPITHPEPSEPDDPALDIIRPCGTTPREEAERKHMEQLERAIASAAESMTMFTNADDDTERHREVETLLGHAYGQLENAVEDIRRIIKLKGA